MAIIELDQGYETPITEYRRGPFNLRYGYSRSKDAVTENLRGEDYLVVKLEANRLAFAICDGVGSSFFGGLASQIVGERLIRWLWDDVTQEIFSSNPQPEEAIKLLDSALNDETKYASQLVAKKDINTLSNHFLRSSYKEKREKSGSQSNFVCGYVEVDLTNPNKGDVWLFWLGDAKMRIWNDLEERSQDLNGKWLSEQSWSTKHGVLGDTFAFHSSLDEISHIIAYSDGLLPSENAITPSIDNNTLNQIFNELQLSSRSDDVSFLEISFNNRPPKYEDDLISTLRGHVLEKVPAGELQDEDVLPPPDNEESGSDKKRPKINMLNRVILIVFFSALILGFLGGYKYQILIQRSQTEVPIPAETSFTPFRPMCAPTIEITLTATEDPLIAIPTPLMAEGTELTPPSTQDENLISPTVDIPPTFSSTQIPTLEASTSTPQN